MIIDESFNSDKLVEFLQALTRDAGKAWVDERKDEIELFYLPSYSPELNPEERLNARFEARALYQGSGTHQGQVESRCN